MRRFGCPRARFGASTRIATRPSARWAIPSTKRSFWAKRGVRGTAGFGGAAGRGRGRQIEVGRRVAAVDVAVGPAGEGLPDALEEETFKSLYRGAARWPANEEQVTSYGTIN